MWARAGHDGDECKRGAKAHLAVDTLGRLRALHIAAAGASDRDAVERLAQEVQDATGEGVAVAGADPAFGLWRKRLGYAGGRPAAALADMQTTAFSMLMLKKAGDLAQKHNMP